MVQTSKNQKIYSICCKHPELVFEDEVEIIYPSAIAGYSPIEQVGIKTSRIVDGTEYIYSVVECLIDGHLGYMRIQSECKYHFSL